AAVLGVAVVLAAPAAADEAAGTADGNASADQRIVFPTSVQQGAMVLGKVPPGSEVAYAGRTLRSTAYGTVVFGVGRDATGPLVVTVATPDGRREAVRIAVTARDWPV